MFKCCAVVCLCLSAHVVVADTITVPTDYATIQAAIDAATDGDVIELDRNVFRGDGNRDLDFLNKALTIRSAPGRAGVRIDAQGTFSAPHRPAFIINQTQPLTFIDLVFERGYAGEATSIVPAGVGGAMYIVDSSNVLFQQCEFRDSEVRLQRGAGAACFNSQVRFEDCSFHDNILGANSGIRGVNFLAEGGSVELIGCTFEAGNFWEASSDDLTVYGVGAAFYGGTHRMENCLVQNNPGTVYLRPYARGAGVYVHANVTIVDTTIRQNHAYYNEDGQGGHGGGLYVSTGGHATVVNCWFEYNFADGGYEPLTWPDYAAGAAICAADGGVVDAINCTFSHNSSTSDDPPALGNLFADSDSAIHVRNSILYYNIGPAYATDGTGVVDFEYSIVQGGAPGLGVVDVDPMFDFDAGYSLLPGSPAIDAGDNGAVPAGILTDLIGNPRFVDDPATTDTGPGPAPIVDMGAYEYQPMPSDCDADLTGDGTLDFFDVQEFLNRYSAGDLSVDFASDGVLDFFDVQTFLNLYAAGCP